MAEYKLTDGRIYAPEKKDPKVVKPGEFVIAAADLDHGHIYGMCDKLVEAGAVVKYVWDDDPAKIEVFLKRFPGTTVVDCVDRILEDPEVKMVCAAGIPNERADLCIRVMEAGKDYFVDKAPMTTLEQVEAVREASKRTGRRMWCYYCERLNHEGSILAGYMVEAGEIGDVIQVLGTGGHRYGATPRPDWFHIHEQYGGILGDIGSHQIEQYLYFTKNEDAKILSARVGNYSYPQYPEFEDYGDATLVGDNGALGYFRLDWHTPDGLRTWSDGRVYLLGTKGVIEVRKYEDIGRPDLPGCMIYFANEKGEQVINANGITGTPFFSQMVLDSLNGTDLAMTQAHTLKAAELCIKAQMQAIHIQNDLMNK